MKEVLVHSSALSGFAYDSEQQQLRIRFRDGHIYLYRLVPPSAVQALLEESSVGEYFNSHIRDQFPYVLLS
jgi:lysyl-tRNA synthetase, class II